MLSDWTGLDWDLENGSGRMGVGRKGRVNIFGEWGIVELNVLSQ